MPIEEGRGSNWAAASGGDEPLLNNPKAAVNKSKDAESTHD